MSKKDPPASLTLTPLAATSSPHSPPLHRALRRAAPLLLVLATLACYAQVLHYHGFLGYDEQEYITDSPFVRQGITLRGLAWAFTTTYTGYAHPLTWLSHMLDCQILGLDAGRHRAVNVLWHAANVLLLLGVIYRLTGSYWRSALVAALFALHPLNVESVAWVAERKTLLTTFCGLLTILFYTRYARRPTLGAYGAVAVCFVLCLLAKPMLVTLPFLLLLLDYWPLRRWTAWPAPRDWNGADSKGDPSIPARPAPSIYRLISEKVPLLGLSLLIAAVTYVAQKSQGIAPGLGAVPLGRRMANALVSYAAYIGKAAWPRTLVFFYPYPRHIPLPSAFAAGAALLAITLLALACLRRHPALPVGWFWFLGTLVPVIGLIQSGAQGMADRYAYWPAIGLFIMVAWSVPDRLARFPAARIALTAIALVVLGALALRTREQVRYWKDDQALCRHVLDMDPDNFLANLNLGVAMSLAGQSRASLPYFERAIGQNPGYGKSHYSYARVLVDLNRLEDAAPQFREALRLDPRGTDAAIQLAGVLDRLHNPEQSLTLLEGAARDDPHNARLLVALGMAYAQRQHDRDAADAFRRAVAVDPNQAANHDALGTALDRLGQPEAALKEYQLALALAPDDSAILENAGTVLLELKRWAQAADMFQGALIGRPGAPVLHQKLALALVQCGRLPQATDQIAQASHLAPSDPVLHNVWGELLAQQGDLRRAQEQFAEAVRLDPHDQGAAQNLEKVRKLLQ